MALVTRFNLDDILGNEVVDFAVLDSNQQIIGNNAAHLTLQNSYTAMQEFHRPATPDGAIQVRLDADLPANPRLVITGGGSFTWPTSTLSVAAGVMTIGGTMLRVPNIQPGAGTAAAPSHSFSTDTDTGLYSPSGDILGVAVGGLEVNRINAQGEIRFNRTNARIAAYTTDDPATPGERLMTINALTITPGRLYAASVTVNGPLQVNGNAQITAGMAVSGGITSNQDLTVSGAINAYGGMIHFEGSNVVNIQWRGDLGALYIPYGNGIYTSYLTVAGGANITGGITVGGRVVAGGYDAGWQNNFAAGANGTITNGRFYQKANAGAYCWDAADFTFGTGPVGNTLVQRTPAGYIMANYLNMTADVSGGRPDYVVGMSGNDNFLRYWPRSALPLAPANPIVLFVHWTGGTSSNYDDRVILTADRAGYWIAVVNFTYNANNNSDIAARFRMGGTITPQALISTRGPVSTQFGWFSGYSGPYTPAMFLNAGEQMSFQWASGQPTGAAADMWALFIPTQAYPGT